VSDDGGHKVGTLVKSCRLLERMSRSEDAARRSDALYFRMLGDYYERLRCAHEEGRPVAMHTVFLPAEILEAMDITPMHAETSTWLTASFTGMSADLLIKAAELGMATEICSAHRGLVGAFALGIMPRPDVIIWSNLMCDNTAKSGDMIMEIADCPGYFLDHPFEESPEEAAYLIEEFKGLIAFLEEKTGRRMDWDRLSEVVARSDQQIQLYREINVLRRAVPSPFPPQRFMELIMPLYLLPGHPDAIEYLETLRDDLALMVARGQGAASRERFRLMSLFVPPMYLLGFLGRISEEHGAVSVTEPFFDMWPEDRLDPSRPLEALVRKSFMFPEMASYGPFRRETLDRTLELARDYRVDGAIYYAHVGCRQASALSKAYKDALDEIDVPMLTLDFDILDPTVAPEEEIQIKLEGFFELLEDR